MSFFSTLRRRLAERRQRRERYAQTLEILSLPLEIQLDIRRPESEPRDAPSPVTSRRGLAA